MSYTAFSGVRTWDGSEAVSIHGATSALGASIDTSLIPSFADETARNTAAAAAIAAGTTGMTCYVVSRRGTCTFIGIPAGGEPPTNGWLWHGQNRLVGNFLVSGFAASCAVSSGTTARVPIISLSVVLTGGQRLVSVYYSLDCQPSSTLPLTTDAVVIGELQVDGVGLADFLKIHQPGGTSTVGAFFVTGTSKTVTYKLAAGTHAVKLNFFSFGGVAGNVDAYDPRVTVTDHGPVD